MKSRKNILLIGIVCLLGVFCIMPELAFAQAAFESKINNITDSLLGVVLPAASIIGLIYAAMLAAAGDGAARGRMTLIVFASIGGFVAPFLIQWLRGIISG